MRGARSYETASARLGPDACARLEEGFTRLCKRPKGLVPMDMLTFQEEVLTPFLDMVRAGCWNEWTACLGNHVCVVMQAIDWPNSGGRDTPA